MADDLEDAQGILRQAAALAPSIRVDLDAAYLEAIAVVESLDANQTGADKTWVWEAEEAFRRHYQHARRA